MIVHGQSGPATFQAIRLDGEGHVVPLSLMGAAQTVEGTPLIELKSIYGLSSRRNATTTAGSGTVTHVGAASGSEFVLATTASGTDVAVMDSAENGRYQPGTSSTVGVGVRLAAGALTGSQVARWGYFDDTDGYGFGLDASGVFVFVRRGGTDTEVRRSDWNGDALDGEGPSGLTLDVTKGDVYQIRFVWYGYGPIHFGVLMSDGSGMQRFVTVHRFRPEGMTSTGNPELPIRAEVRNGGTAAAQTMYVAGRQYSVMGRFNPSRRINGVYLAAAVGSIGSTWVPLATFRRKTAFAGMGVKLEGVEVLADNDLYWQVRYGATLTGATYGTPPDTTAAETACEVDTAATAVSGGDVFYPGGVIPASTNQARTLSGDAGINLDVPALEPITLCVRTIPGAATASVRGAMLRWREEW